MSITDLDKTQWDDFQLLVDAAVKGERCPQSNPHGPIHAGSMTALWKAGMIKSEVYRHNYRVVTILSGEHAGKQTAPCSLKGARPYRVNGEKIYYDFR